MSTTALNRSHAAEAALEVHLCGVLDYDAYLALQERLIFDISGRGDQRGALLICEFPPLITMGRGASRSQLLASDAELSALGIDVRWIARSGPAVVHAPGQLIVTPILPLDRLGIGLSAYRSRFEEAVQAACHDMRVPARRRAGQPGLWSRTGRIADFGGAVKSWVAHHGMFLNVDPDPSFLKLVQPSTEGERATSLQAQRLRPISMAGVREAVIRRIVDRFGYQRYHVYTGHPQLRRTRRKVCLHV